MRPPLADSLDLDAHPDDFELYPGPRTETA
jgi:hypothetical protein